MRLTSQNANYRKVKYKLYLDRTRSTLLAGMSGRVLIGVQAGRAMPANSGQSLARRLLQHCQADLRRRLAIALAGHADLLTMRPAGGKSKRTSQSQRVSNNICRRIGKQGYPRDRPLLPKSGFSRLPPVRTRSQTIAPGLVAGSAVSSIPPPPRSPRKSSATPPIR